MIYDEAKRRDPQTEVAVVWEIELGDREEWDGPLPEPDPQIQPDEYEYHLDHPNILKQ